MSEMEKSVARHLATAYRNIYHTDDFIPLHAPRFSGKEKEYLNECIDTGWVSSVGKFVDKFRDEICKYSGAKYCVPVCSGTAALHLALLANGVRPGDAVICPDISFVATAAAIVYCGATPIFIDIDNDTLSLSPEALKEFLETSSDISGSRTSYSSTKQRISACIVMHNIGFPARIDEIISILKPFNIPVIEDAAESLGSTLNGKMCGTIGTTGVYSFNGNKIITTGGGGALITDDENIYKFSLHLSTTAKVPHPYSFIHDHLGYNYRMPNLNAAVGLAQIEQLDSFIHMKKLQIRKLSELISHSNIKLLSPPFGEWNHWFCVAYLEGIKLDLVIQYLAEFKIMARPLWSRISQMPPYRNYPCGANPISKNLIFSTLCLPNGIATN